MWGPCNLPKFVGLPWPHKKGMVRNNFAPGAAPPVDSSVDAQCIADVTVDNPR